MKNPRRLIIPADAADLRDQHAGRKSAVAFFLIFGGGFFSAAIVVAWPFNKLTSFYWMVFAVLCFFGLAFVAVFIFQMRSIMRNLSNTRTVFYVGVITGKRLEESGETTNHFIVMGEKEFEVHEELYNGVRIGDMLGVREWLSSGEYIEHTLNPRRIAALEKRAL